MKIKLFLSVLVAIIFSVKSMAQNFPYDEFQAGNEKTLNIYFVKHSSLILKYDGKYIYVDPVSEYMDCSAQPKADVILITHEHSDHFDINAIDILSKENTLFILNEASQKKLGKGKVMKNGDEWQATPYLRLKAVPAYNTTPGREHNHPMERDNGYIVTIGNLRVYIAGDTEDIPELKEINNIDVAFLPVNQPYTMTVEQAVNAAMIIRPAILYPYHYNETKVEKIKELLAGQPDVEVRIRDLQ